MITIVITPNCNGWRTLWLGVWMDGFPLGF